MAGYKEAVGNCPMIIIRIYIIIKHGVTIDVLNKVIMQSIKDN